MMIKNVLENLFSRPATRVFPAVRRDAASGNRGTVDFNTEECVYCGACALKCPSEAIKVDRQARTLTFDLFKCVACACCAEACKKGCVQMVAQYHAPCYQKPDLLFQGAPVVAGDSSAKAAPAK